MVALHSRRYYSPILMIMRIDIDQILSNPELSRMAAEHLSYALADVQTYEELTPKEREIISREDFDKIIIETIDTYHAIKEKRPHSIILVKVGLFFATFDEDAEKVSRTLGISAENNKASFPSCALDTYLPKLIRAGHNVAICENL